jgi:DNA-binding NtrC family response regulator
VGYPTDKKSTFKYKFTSQGHPDKKVDLRRCKMRSDAAVLFVNGEPAEALGFERILGEHMVLKRVQDLAELQADLPDGNHYDAVLCGWSFRKGDWKDALGYVLQRSPDLPVIVFSRMGTEREWVEVLGAGAFDLLAAPYGERSVLAALEHAVASYEGRHLKNGFQRRSSQRRAGRERSRANIASRQVRGGTRRISHGARAAWHK